MECSYSMGAIQNALSWQQQIDVMWKVHKANCTQLISRNIYIGSPICILGFQYLYWASNIHIWLPICISDFQYAYLTSNMYIWLLICISDFQYVYQTSDMYIWLIGLPISILDFIWLFNSNSTPYSNVYIWLPICISDFRYVYLTSDMYIWLLICILDFQYVYYGFLTQTAPHIIVCTLV